MADRILCLSWGAVVRGRERRSLEVFNDAVGYYTGLQQQGGIERFDLVLLTPNGSVGGMMLLYGTHAQVEAIREDDRFLRITLDAGMVVDDLRVVDGYANEGIAEPMGRFQEAIANVQQPAHA
ncbi:hypothetical protein [Conexibacter woesei]|uniref:Uncharacterized protein n=1 Tax=Conexibacter woesei (strain DSM 14684 / CCUG 47730 / CIP 108061 / JCM 11494 / NBRC 100937 / ID131577) TaxID=469383 RepID=D3F1Y0_CONWI|nr:hypothetical protein [Conexibacter woesei]ADB54161.1 hypothetical protein Cwoe_5760 [Conexibacter woesei DSM 14684]